MELIELSNLLDDMKNGWFDIVITCLSILCCCKNNFTVKKNLSLLHSQRAESRRRIRKLQNLQVIENKPSVWKSRKNSHGDGKERVSLTLCTNSDLVITISSCKHYCCLMIFLKEIPLLSGEHVVVLHIALEPQYNIINSNFYINWGNYFKVSAKKYTKPWKTPENIFFLEIIHLSWNRQKLISFWS